MHAKIDGLDKIYVRRERVDALENRINREKNNSFLSKQNVIATAAALVSALSVFIAFYVAFRGVV